MQLNEENILISKRDHFHWEMGRKRGKNFSLPGSRTPRCPVTGDDVTDTPEEMYACYVTAKMRLINLAAKDAALHGDFPGSI
jgi:hypothetical protein